MSSILSAQNLHTFRRRNIGRRWPSFPCWPPCPPALPRPPPPPPPSPPAPPSRPPCPGHRRRRTLASRSSLHLGQIKPVIVFHVAALSFARLSVGRQAARHASPAGRIGAGGRRPLDLRLIFVDADNEVANDQIRHLQASIDLLHQLAPAVDRLEDVGAFLVGSDFVGQPAPPPVIGFVDFAAEALSNLLHLRMQVGDLGVGRFRRHDVHEFVLTIHCSPSGLTAANAARS